MDPFRFEDNLANVCFSGLTARGIPHGAPRADIETTQERVEVTAYGFDRASNQMAQSASGVWFNSHYSGTLAFAVITQVAGTHAANHAAWVANVRSLMDRSSQFFTANNLPAYAVLRVAESSQDAPESNRKTDAHRTTLLYTVDLAIDGSYVA